MELVILDDARKRGYPDSELRHVVAFAIRVIEQSDGMTMFIGADSAGNLMEVGTIILSDGREAIAHAMKPARDKYLPKKSTRRKQR